MSFYLYFRDPEAPTEVYKINRLVWVFNSFVLFLWRSKLIPKWVAQHVRLRLWEKKGFFDVIRSHQNSWVYHVEYWFRLRIQKVNNLFTSVWKMLF